MQHVETRYGAVEWGLGVRIERKWGVARRRSNSVAKCNSA